MTTLMTKDTKQAHHQATMLSLMGITQYVKKEALTEPTMGYQDRMQCMSDRADGTQASSTELDAVDSHQINKSMLDGHDVDVLKHLDSVLNTAEQSDDKESHHTHQLTNVANQSTKTNIVQLSELKLPTALPTGGQVVVTADKFAWFGMAYRHFILLGDVKFLDTTTKSVWQSLTDKLSKQSGQVPSEIEFPLGGFDSFGQMAAMGFLIKLGVLVENYIQGNPDKKPTYLFLTPMRDGVIFDVNVVPCPSLDDMAKFKQAKLDFWALLHA